ncbi:hypothetical protein CLOSTASPAR_01648 [[Clostridium] asparagiforme DSM 15981]|uniref:Uncharacterized protein n=1 Tax=[Clostridium] asparagiforme DSM 15981 TaxID=518636 RepID=C0CXC7_9FIRM|nr:hypothetical protein CLOSTASPAR_01648 [[Clostridium] asparagiforme DSM 15981]
MHPARLLELRGGIFDWNIPLSFCPEPMELCMFNRKMLKL